MPMKFKTIEQLLSDSRLEGRATAGHGEELPPKKPESSEASINAPYVRTESEIATNNSIMYSPLSTPPKDSSDGIASLNAFYRDRRDGKSSAQSVTLPKREEKESSDKNIGKGIKSDQGKPPLAYIPKAALYAEAEAFAFGAKKYDAWNYKNGLAVTRTLSAALRHITQFLSGEDLDSESGVHHLGCARANLAMALDTLENHPKLDDRFTSRKPYKKE